MGRSHLQPQTHKRSPSFTCCFVAPVLICSVKLLPLTTQSNVFMTWFFSTWSFVVMGCDLSPVDFTAGHFRSDFDFTDFQSFLKPTPFML